MDVAFPHKEADLLVDIDSCRNVWQATRPLQKPPVVVLASMSGRGKVASSGMMVGDSETGLEAG